MAITRRQFCWCAGAGAAGMGTFGAYVMAGTEPKVIKISAQKFAFTPAVVTLKRGQAVILELTSLDVIMGFNAPDFGVRTDIVPGKTQQLRIVPDKVGEFTYLCDVFCGTGHEEMNGKIIVVA